LERTVVETMHVKETERPLCYSIVQTMRLASFMHNVAATYHPANQFLLSPFFQAA